MENRREFGKWLQEKRLEVGYSQAQAAKILKFNTRANVVGYENGNAPGLLRPFKYIERGFKHDGNKRYEGILHQRNKNDGRVQPAFRNILPDYPGPGKKLSIFPVGLDQIEYQTNEII